MNDNAIKNYAVWARRELMSEVEKRCAWWGISDEAEANAESIDGRVLSAQERKQRTDLLRIVKSDGYGQLVEKAAYTWFNRLLAIRFMEVNDRLPSHVRMLSSANGEFEPQCLREALDLPLDALDKDEAVRLVQAGDDEALFRLVFLAQCAELAECMPAVFEKVGSAMELLLPTGLLRRDGIVGQLVEQIPEDDWREGVEIVGWMYQYYVSERKDEVFASFKKGKKAERDAIAPATQLFTPHWIVRYLTENSLGRLWMLNHPDSKLVEKMPYFIKPDEEHETEFRRISSPEEITCVDPACGSGHILVYAFELLAAMYEEAGYSNRDAARLIVEKNLTGLEIDPRAAAMASFALTMKACELDSRFLRRGVQPRITVLERVELEPNELALCPNLAERTPLLDAVAHLDECGSLLLPERDDLGAIERDLASLAGEDSLFADASREKLGLLLKALRPLAARYDVVVANPPYMGGANMNRWVAEWVKKAYPNSKRDICTCFIERGGSLVEEQGYIGMITASSWMFISSFEDFRRKLLSSCSICSMIQQSTHGYAGVTVPTTMFVLADGQMGIIGSYIRLEDFDRPQLQEAKALEALANPECGWFYRADASGFAAIPGSPIAYWASSTMMCNYVSNDTAAEHGRFLNGMSTGKNEAVLRYWFEVSLSAISFHSKSQSEFSCAGKKYAPYNKGGEYRKWWGNQESVIAYDNESNELMDSFVGHRHNNPDTYFQACLSWSKISSGVLAMRFFPPGFVYDVAGCSLFCNENGETYLLLALFNSCIAMRYLQILSPTLNFEAGQIRKIPYITPVKNEAESIDCLSKSAINTSRDDWSHVETAWDFKSHPLI